MIERLIARPMPSPWALVVTNGWKMVASSDSGRRTPGAEAELRDRPRLLCLGSERRNKQRGSTTKERAAVHHSIT